MQSRARLDAASSAIGIDYGVFKFRRTASNSLILKTMMANSAGERKFGTYFGKACSFLARRDEAAWQAPCNEEQQRQGRS